MNGKYDDIINMEYPYPSKHEKMSMYERAAQFSPFAALTGYDEIIKEEARYVEGRTALSEDDKEKINEALNIIASDTSRYFDITYFIPDSRKASGGEYARKEKATMKKISEKDFLTGLQETLMQNTSSKPGKADLPLNRQKRQKTEQNPGELSMLFSVQKKR